ncbi:Cadherin-like beta sandwich domain protein [Mucilaginibacter gotjawali]|uniref:Cadherin-like beta sandwich domain protein n=1 Tax=Mucilaginibacter gotjawali TaxID=1550579 RepID=A0A125T201_9SPHI|nr:cadherin-like beta sandwich domain-containing protein [Mucilaginibacter gotjawali]BAU52148.1 Cadherin-like beta sandwich domain protein [Mucilaginibacter gotjawali]
MEIYAGTGEGFLNGDAIQGLGVWKSTDGGATWAHLASTAGFKYINAILVDKNGHVYIAGETDIFVGFGVDQSTDGGSTWTNVINSAEAGADLQMAANGDVYASTGVIYLTGHIYISDFTVNGTHTGNAGTWTNITPASNGTITPGTTAWNRIKLATAPSDANIVYGFFEPDYSSTGNLKLSSVQQYNKSANTWTVKAVPTEAFSNGQSWYSIAAAIDPNNPSVLYAGSLDAEKSTDGGLTWTRYSVWSAATTASNYVHADHHAYVYAPGSSTRLMMGTDGGVFYTVNANVTPSFVNKNNGYNVTQYYSVALHPTSTNYALAGAQDNGSQIFTSAGIGPTSVATGGDGADVFIDQTNGNIQVTSYVYDNYYVSTDNGVSFHGLSGFGNGQFINPTAYDPSTKNLYAGSASGYYYRAANILSPTYNEVAVSAFAGANVTTVAVAPITANRVYFGLDNGSVVRVDNAQTGTSLAGVVLAPSLGSNINVSCVAVDPASEDHIMVTYSNYGVTHVIQTTNASAATPTWTNVSGNLPDMPVRWALFYPGDPTKAIIATELGVWTTDLINGSSTVWDPTNTGLANVEVDMLAYRASDRTLAAATHGRGLFTATVPSPFSNNANLANMQLSTGTLNPVFASGTTSYTASVPNSVASITLTPTTSDATATIKVNGTAVTSGTASGALPLVVGPNTITTVVTAQDGVTTQTYTVNVTRSLPANANLSKLTISAGTLTPAFATATTSYTASVANTITSITVTPKATDALATIKVNGTAVSSGTASGAIPLSVGTNVINTVVKAQNGTTKTYTITVTRSLPANADLTKLTLSAGTLTPVFATATTSYTASVANSVTSLTVTPKASDALATITVNGTAVSSGTASGGIPLSVGPNTVTTIVTAQDGVTTKTYTVTVTRMLPANANLSNLTISGGTLTPAFATATTSYTASVANAVTSMTVTPKASDALATITVNGTAVSNNTASGAIPLTVGTNVITTVVTAQNGTTTKSYTVTVTRFSNNANLANLQLSTGTLNPVFASGTTGYTASVPNSQASVTLTPTTSDATATITVNGTAVTSGAASGAIALSVGPNTITTVVTAQDGVTTKTYTVTLTRSLPANPNLSNLTLSAGPLTPAFATATTSYTASVANSVSSTTVTPKASDALATITVNGTAVASGSASGAIALNLGNTIITTVVKAQNGTTAKTYTITVTRAAAIANLSAEVSVSNPTDHPQMMGQEITVHLGLSPNGDGINDFLLIDGITSYPDNKLQIMNRSGALVFEAKGYDNSNRVFDGHSNKTGAMQLPGTYFYSLDYTANGTTKHKTGYIVLKY